MHGLDFNTVPVNWSWTLLWRTRGQRAAPACFYYSEKFEWRLPLLTFESTCTRRKFNMSTSRIFICVWQCFCHEAEKCTGIKGSNCETERQERSGAHARLSSEHRRRSRDPPHMVSRAHEKVLNDFNTFVMFIRELFNASGCRDSPACTLLRSAAHVRVWPGY